MATSFANTLCALERKESWLAWLAPALLLLGAWWLWALLAEVEVYSSASRARVEVSRMPHRVAAEEGGRIVELHCELGRLLQAGELLAQLDPSVEQARLAQERASLDSFQVKLRALQKQFDAERAKRQARSQLDELATERAGFELQRAVAGAARQRALTEIVQELRQEQLSSRVEAVQAEGELERTRIQVDDAATEVQRSRAAQAYEENAQLARLAELERQLAELRADGAVKQASIHTLERQLERRRVLAPASGRVGSIAALQVGDVVRPGDLIATLIPAADVRVVAEFAPEQAVGRVAPGQPARLRLDGFAWTEFGALAARVTHVASEPREGTIRVELSLAADGLPAVPVQHGLPGAVDVRVGSGSPWALLKRGIGTALMQARSPASAPAAGEAAR